MAAYDERPKRLFHRGHHNIVANQISKQLDRYVVDEEGEAAGAIHALLGLTYSLCERFEKDNPHIFDRETFLKACSTERLGDLTKWEPEE